MQYYTIGKKYLSGKIAHIHCESALTRRNINIKGQSFLLIILYNGEITFRVKEQIISATAPAFLCFDETENIALVKKMHAKALSVYFHPQFLNVNMTFDNIRSKKYADIAGNHDMFLMRPFLSETCVYPASDDYIAKALYTFREMELNLVHQEDVYWSCRSRSYFMEIIIMLERIYHMLTTDHVVLIDEKRQEKEISSKLLQTAILYIDSHYNERILLEDIVAVTGSNHTTITRLFKEETGETPMEYLWYVRINHAKKNLAFTNIPIKEAAVRAGFSTLSHFSRMFKEKTGQTPASYRKSSVEKRKAVFL